MMLAPKLSTDQGDVLSVGFRWAAANHSSFKIE